MHTRSDERRAYRDQYLRDRGQSTVCYSDRSGAFELSGLSYHGEPSEYIVQRWLSDDLYPRVYLDADHNQGKTGKNPNHNHQRGTLVLIARKIIHEAILQRKLNPWDQKKVDPLEPKKRAGAFMSNNIKASLPWRYGTYDGVFA